MYIVSTIVINPITAVASELKKIDPFGEIHLRETRIIEIDQLTHSIEKMSVAVADSASKISKIIDLAHIPIGVFEYDESENRFFCSSKLIHILGWDESKYNESLLENALPDLIKLNKTIIHRIDEDLEHQQHLKKIVMDAKSRNIKIVAEGIETQKEMETVISFGVDYLQGYYIGRPEININPIDENVVQEIKTAKNNALCLPR